MAAKRALTASILVAGDASCVSAADWAAPVPDMSGDDLGVDPHNVDDRLARRPAARDEALEPSRHSPAPRESLARTDVGSQVGRKLESA